MLEKKNFFFKTEYQECSFRLNKIKLLVTDSIRTKIIWIFMILYARKGAVLPAHHKIDSRQ